MNVQEQDHLRFLVWTQDDGILGEPAAPVEALFGSGTDTLVVNRDGLPPAFFDLRSGFAGETLQKLTNYRLRMVVVGDFSDLGSKAWQDFLRETNRTGKVVFESTMAAGLSRLR